MAAELADRRTRPPERALEHLAGLLRLAALEEVDRRVEHERDTGERLNRPVMEEERDPAALVLLDGEDLLGRIAPRGLVVRSGTARAGRPRGGTPGAARGL